MGNDGAVEEVGIYIHFPFCAAKCPYCHFYSVPAESGLIRRWLKGLECEASLRSEDKSRIDTLYVGGGTPSLLKACDLFRILETLKTNFHLDLKEFTLEASPEIKEESLIRDWKDAGVNRLSIGVQSFDDRVLKILGRRHTARQAERLIERAQRAGFGQIGIDLMIGVPGETQASLEMTLQKIKTIAPQHVSLYILENIEGLPFEAVVRDSPLDEDAAASAYEFMLSGLEELGLARYEISNFARAGQESLHNLKYWRYEPFLGLGPSACSHFGAERWSNVQDLGTWAADLKKGHDCRREVKRLSPRDRLQEALIFGMRLVGGIRFGEFKKRFGMDLSLIYEKEIEELKDESLILVEEDSLRIPKDKYLISNSILSRFI